MEKVRYMISDAANIVNVESHVLRYWEDELELNGPRNELGRKLEKLSMPVLSSVFCCHGWQQKS